jgi:hypothetical protein
MCETLKAPIVGGLVPQEESLVPTGGDYGIMSLWSVKKLSHRITRVDLTKGGHDWGLQKQAGGKWQLCPYDIRTLMEFASTNWWSVR